MEKIHIHLSFVDYFMSMQEGDAVNYQFSVCSSFNLKYSFYRRLPFFGHNQTLVYHSLHSTQAVYAMYFILGNCNREVKFSFWKFPYLFQVITTIILTNSEENPFLPIFSYHFQHGGLTGRANRT